jgi:molybdopterin converting factor subunit 1
MMNVTLLFFATLRDRAGARSMELDLPEGSTVQDLKAQLVREIPGFEQAMQSVLVSINREYASDEDLVPEGAEVALFPPVSGG